MSKPPPHTFFFTALLPTVLLWRPHRNSSASYLQITWLNMTLVWKIGRVKAAETTPKTRIQQVRSSVTTPQIVHPTVPIATTVLPTKSDDLDAAFNVMIKTCNLQDLSAEKKHWLKKQLAQYPLIQSQLRQQDIMHPYQYELLKVWVGNLLEGYGH